MEDAASQKSLAAKRQKKQKKEEEQSNKEKRGQRKTGQAETEVDQRAEDEPKPKRSKSKDTVWAYVLEKQRAVLPSKSTYKLRLSFAQYVCTEFVDDLAQSVEDVLYKSGYIRPENTNIFSENPFATAVQKRDRKTTYHLRDGVSALDNNESISDANREATQPFSVLVSKLWKRQPVMDATAAPFAAVQAAQRAQAATALTNGLMQQAIRPGGFLKVSFAAAVQLLGIMLPPQGEIFYRPAYRELLELINTKYDSRVQMEQRVFISVTGTPDIGKSTMLLIFLLENLRMEKTVAFFRDEHLGTPAIPLLFRWDKDSNSVSVQVREVYDSHAVTLTDSSGPGTAFMGLVIWAHWPGAEEDTAAAKQFSKEVSSVFALPLWTDDEVATVHARCNVPHSVEDLTYNQSLWGNVPRQIFRPKQEAEWRMQRLLESLKTHPEESILTHLVLAHAGSSNLIQESLMLMNVETDLRVPDDNYRPGIRFCTPYVYGQLLDMLNEDVGVAQRKLMELFYAVPEAGGALGNLFEAFAHRYLGCTTREYALTAVPNELMDRGVPT